MKTELLLIVFFVATVHAEPVSRPQGCDDILKVTRNTGENAKSGVYKIFPPVNNALHSNGVEVFCDMETDGGGWTVMQRRRESDLPQINFYRHWSEYANGFGLLSDSFWLGLDLISYLTNTGNFKLRVDLMDWEEEERYAEYAFFRVANSTDNYGLTINGYSGNAGDSIANRHNGKPFSSKDRDNDDNADSCAQIYQGGWWYTSCYDTNLNGVYGQVDRTGVVWVTWRGQLYSMKRVEMKIRRVDDDVTNV